MTVSDTNELSPNTEPKQINSNQPNNSSANSNVTSRQELDQRKAALEQRKRKLDEKKKQFLGNGIKNRFFVTFVGTNLSFF